MLGVTLEFHALLDAVLHEIVQAVDLVVEFVLALFEEGALYALRHKLLELRLLVDAVLLGLLGFRPVLVDPLVLVLDELVRLPRLLELGLPQRLLDAPVALFIFFL